MSFKEFLSKYNGQKNVGNTTENKGQCVGLSAVWVDSLSLPHIWGHAMDLFVNADEKFFDKILNTPDAIPQAGDIIVWNKSFNGTFGHTGIATGTGDLNTFEAFEQNDPLGSNCHLKTYNYNSVLGWLRPLITIEPSADSLLVLKSDFENLVRKSSIYDLVCQKLNVADNEGIVLAELDKLISYEDMVVQKDKQIGEANVKISDLEDQLKGLSENYQKVEETNTTLAHKVEEQGLTIDKSTNELNLAQKALQELKDQLQHPIFMGWKKLIYDLLIKL